MVTTTCTSSSKEIIVVTKISPDLPVEDSSRNTELEFEPSAEVFHPHPISSGRFEQKDEISDRFQKEGDDGILLAGKYFLPPGFRFHPTDQELVLYYLKRKICGLKMELDVIAEIDMYEFEPWGLHEVSCLQTKDLQWYFFCPKVRKYPKGNRENRVTPQGRWKPSGKDRSIFSGKRLAGTRKCLIYYDRRSKKEERTDWVMHEFRLTDEESQRFKTNQNNFVLCRIFKKSGRGSKLGEQYGAPMENDEMESIYEAKQMVGYVSDNYKVGQMYASSGIKECKLVDISNEDDSPSDSTEKL